MRMNSIEITIKPIDTGLDVEVVKKHLESIPFTMKDPVEEYPDELLQSYMVCGSEETLSYCKEARLVNPNRFPWSCTVVGIYPGDNKIGIYFYGDDNEDPRFIEAAKFVVWFINKCPSKVTDGEGFDWTDKVNHKGALVLFE